MHQKTMKAINLNLMKRYSAKIAGLLFVLLSGLAASALDDGMLSGFDPTSLVGRDRSFGADFSKEKFLVLCYHDVPVKIVDDRDEYAVELENLVLHIEFLKSEGFSFVGADDLLAAAERRKELPAKSVLLSFDDAYESFYTHVFPLLKIYKIPAILAVVPAWIDKGELSEYKKKFMSWEQIKEVSDSGLVNVASHSSDMHKSVLSHPLGSTSAAFISRIYDPAAAKYETDDEYWRRISEDISGSFNTLKERNARVPDSIVWPYGRYNGATVEAAKKAGFKMMFTLDSGLANINRLDAIPRYMLMGNPTATDFAKEFRKKFVEHPRHRIVHADIDPVYSPDHGQMLRNIDKFIERICNIKPHAVYLQAFCDSDGDGNVESLYFPNGVLPTRADIFGRISRALSIRGIAVYAWMPVMSFQLPDAELTKRLRVCEFRDGENKPSVSWYERLSPFSEDACRIIERIYEDLAKNCSFEGVIFQDDAYMNDFEDFGPDATAAYLKTVGSEKFIPFQSLPVEKKNAWTDAKTDKLVELTSRIMAKVLYYRPETLFARTVYAPILTNPGSEEWFCQNYDKCLMNYDFTVVMAYPRMEGKFWERDWLRELVRKAGERPDGLRKTVFKVQAFDWKEDEWIPDSKLRRWVRALVAAGAHHVSYYPDGLFEGRPGLGTARDIMSSRDFPLDKPGR